MCMTTKPPVQITDHTIGTTTAVQVRTADNWLTLRVQGRTVAQVEEMPDGTVRFTVWVQDREPAYVAILGGN